MKKIKLWKKITIFICIILLIFIIINTRKFFIISSLNKKFSKYENCQNCHYLKHETTLNKREDKIIEVYKKDNVVKSITKFNENIITEFVYPNERRTYAQIQGEKEISMQKSKQDLRIIPNYLDGLDKMSIKTIVDYIKIRIITEELDGKDCYVMYNNDAKIYFDKDTGLAIKVEMYFDEETYIITYQYSFNEVTDKDVEELNLSDYEVIPYSNLEKLHKIY